MYDWDETQEEDLANLHKYGKAKSFMCIGRYSFQLTWIEGARFPKNVDASQDNYDLSITSFDGIDDNEALKNAYDYGVKYYNNLNGGVIEW